MLAITIIDEGCGAPEDALEQIFDPFFRVPSQNPHRGGARLGLSISKRIATLYGRSIAAQNRADGRLLIQLCLPLIAHDEH